MFRKPFVLFLLALALVSLACSITLDLPEAAVKTGETLEEEISIPAPDDGDVAELTLFFGAGDLYLEPGAGADLVSGMVKYNVADFKPEINQRNEEVELAQGSINLNGIPSFKDDIVNEWDLKLGDAEMILSISAGAYSGRYDLGGLSIQRLSITDGASDVKLEFSQPNLVELASFDYKTGASDVTLEKLGNANMSTMTFSSGAGSYRLDFSGDLQRDLDVRVESGISQVVIVVPNDVPAEVTFSGGMSNVDFFGDWEEDGSLYTQPGKGEYKITITVEMGAGNLELRNK